MPPTGAPERRLAVAGNTVRLTGPAGARLVLVTGDGLASAWWLSALTLARRPTLRHYITRSDVEALLPCPGGAAGPVLHVRPSVAPAFLVVVHGWIVDWFPAPLPEEAACDPGPLLDAVESRLAAYTSRRPD